MTALATGALALAVTERDADEELVDDVIGEDEEDEQHDEETAAADDDDGGDNAAALPTSAEPIPMPALTPVGIQPVFAGLASIIPEGHAASRDRKTRERRPVA
jgi:hypothetical protein